MPRKPKFHEPLAVERLRHLFQYFDAPRVVFDEVVVGAEDGGDFTLGGERGQPEREISNIIKSYAGLICCTLCTTYYEIFKYFTF